MKILGIYGGQDPDGLTASLVKTILAALRHRRQPSLLT